MRVYCQELISLHIFGYYFFAPNLRFKHNEVQSLLPCPTFLIISLKMAFLQFLMKILIFISFLILKRFTLLPQKCTFVEQNMPFHALSTVLLKDIQYGYEIFQNVQPTLQNHTAK